MASSQNDTMVDDMYRLKMEHEHGQYDLLAMIEEAKKSNLLDNHADYIAWSKFEIRKVDGKGRGLVATNKIDAGELLIACKAFAFVHTKTEVRKSNSGGPLAPMVEKARNKLMDQPDLAEEFYRLYAGPQLGHLEEWTEGESELIDENRIKGIINVNTFSAEDIFDIDHSPMGLWLTPSYINHTCVDTNCYRYFVGDFIFIRASKPVAKGNEILFQYVSEWETFEKRQSACKKYGFDCQCRLCVVEREYPPVEILHRVDELIKFMAVMKKRAKKRRNNLRDDIPTLKTFLQEYEDLDPPRDLNTLALYVQETVAISDAQANPNESFRLMTEYFKVLRSNGSFERAMTITKIMYKYQASRCSEGKNEQEKWMEEARRITKLIYGDERMADLIFKEC